MAMASPTKIPTAASGEETNSATMTAPLHDQADTVVRRSTFAQCRPFEVDRPDSCSCAPVTVLANLHDHEKCRRQSPNNPRPASRRGMPCIVRPNSQEDAGPHAQCADSPCSGTPPRPRTLDPVRPPEVRPLDVESLDARSLLRSITERGAHDVLP